EIKNSGTAEAPIRFEGYDGQVKIEGSVKTVKGRARFGRGGVKISGEHVKLSGITVLKYGTGISLGGHHNTVENCTAGLCSWSAISVGGHHNEVRHCTAYNCGMTNIFVGGHDNTAADCWSYCHPRLIGIIPGVDTGTDYCYASCSARNIHYIRCRGDGRLVSGHGLEFTRGGAKAGDPESRGCINCRVTECEMYNCWTLFGARHGSRDITFTDCYGASRIRATADLNDLPAWCRHSIDWNSHGFYIRTGAHNVLVKNCRVRGVRWGLDADDARRRWKKEKITRNVTFQNCIVTECIFGVQAAAPNTRVLNCLIARNKYGILIDVVKDVSVKNCIIYQNAVAIRGNEPTAKITHCNLWSNEKKLFGKGRETWASGSRCYKNEKELEGKAMSLGADCISRDPQFVARNTRWGVIPGPFNDNWRLKDTSPCKDMGPYAADPKASIGMR
ncbi:MAG: right-handed parallel beta-helix repeat-containing protein, partial [Phycisphaerae bacterium]|nr:right-handed parallel beta-helix repeat-containing protein [Phycisphaerae bacterium]